MQINELQQLFGMHPELDVLTQELSKKGNKHLLLKGLHASAKAFILNALVSRLHAHNKGNVCFIVLDNADDLLRRVVVCALDYLLEHVGYLGRRTPAFLVVLDDRLGLDEQDAQSHDDGAVRNGVPRERKSQDVDEDSEHDHAEIVEDLRHGPAEDAALDLLLVLLGCLHSCRQVYHAGDDHKDAADEDDGHSVADVLRYV